MAGDYRNEQDEANAQAYSGKNVADAFNSLGDMLLRARQQRNIQNLEEANKEKYSAFTAAQQKETRKQNLQQAEDLVNKGAGVGKKLNVKIGDIDVSQTEENPLKYMSRSQQAGNKALSHAYDIYAKGVPDIMKSSSAAEEGLNALNDPTQSGSLGIVRSQMLRSMGMNRYNDNEAKATMPPNLYQYAKTLFNGVSSWDGDTSKAPDDVNPMSAQQKQAANSFFRGALQVSLQKHQVFKSMALDSYRNSGYFDPDRAKQFQATVGQDLDQHLQSIMAPKPGTPPSNYNSPPPQGPAPQKGLLDKAIGGIQSIFGGKPQQQPQAQQQAPANPLSAKAAKYRQYLNTGGAPIPDAEQELKAGGVQW